MSHLLNRFARLAAGFALLSAVAPVLADQQVAVDATAAGPRFDGVGSVSGGGATSVLLKDYAEPQRSQVLDLLFKPNFGASLSALYVEVPGDGNSTQGTEPSHMHTRDEENYFRGYEWWIMREAKARNPALSLDAAAWGCPAWVGGGKFWSQDMCDYYVKWVQGLKRVHGLDLDALGCRNEKGYDLSFIKMLRKSLNAAGLNAVKTHGFDNWGKNKFEWVSRLETDPELRDAVDVISNHTMSEVAAPKEVQDLAKRLNKPIWNTEEHVYKKGFEDALELVHVFNDNFITSHVTKICSWYLVGSVYDNEPYPVDPALIIANKPWSGHYDVREVLWAYAHYGQFTRIGWEYVETGCTKLDGGGSVVMLKAPSKAAAAGASGGVDYSIIAETQKAAAPQTVTLKLAGPLSRGRLCVWKSDAKAQFVKQPDLTPAGGTVTLTLEPNALYSFSTTRGQAKGGFANVPADKPFPLPYADDFEHYGNGAAFGYLPHYTADITGVFEIAPRPDGKGTCVKQVVTKAVQAWAPEWMPYTIFGDTRWTDYEVSADVQVEHDGWAGVMGRIGTTGGGYGCNPQGYYLRLRADGTCELYLSNAKKNGAPGKLLASGNTVGIGDAFHNMKLRFEGTKITGLVDDNEVLTATDATYARGNAGLVSGGENNVRYAAYFDNVLVNKPNAESPSVTATPSRATGIYKAP